MTNWEERAKELLFNVCEGPVCNSFVPPVMVKLGREMSDARAEEIAVKCETFRDDHLRAVARGSKLSDGLVMGLERGAFLARLSIAKPKTREQVLEEALKEIRRLTALGDAAGIARRALEWRPTE